MSKFGYDEVEHVNMAKPGKQHCVAVKWVMRHLAGFCDKGEMVGNSCRDMVIGFVDSDSAGSLDIKKSQIEYVLTMYGTIVSWKICLQVVVAVFTTKRSSWSSEAVKEGLRLKGSVSELGYVQVRVKIACDNQGVINVKFHFVRKVVELRKVIFVKIIILILELRDELIFASERKA